MGVVIYINGGVVAEGERLNTFLGIIEKASEKNKVFTVRDDEISFRFNQTDGSDPIEDYVLKDLRKLCDFADQMNISLCGDFDITSDWNDYDNITIRVMNEVGKNQIKQYNTELLNAPDEELIAILKSRGYIITTLGGAQK